MNLSALRLAFRIAYRDARRSTGRSALVIILLGLPVFTVAVGATLIDSFEPSHTEQAAREMGAADAIVAWEFDEPIFQDPVETSTFWPDTDDDTDVRVEHTEEEILQALPAGSELLQITGGSSETDTPSGVTTIALMGIDLSHPATEGMVTLLDGEAPGAGEVVLSSAAADHLAVRVGDPLQLHDRDGEWTVSGIVEKPGGLDEEFAAAAPDVIGGKHKAWLADTPQPISWDEVGEYNELGMAVFSQAVAADPPADTFAFVEPADAEQFGIIGVVIGMIMLEIVLLAGPAFAISTKRRSREFALLGATGATPAQVRRTVLAGGLILGGLSAALSLGLGVATAYAIAPLVENVMAQRMAGFRIWPLLSLSAAAISVITGAMAALVPAYTVARQHIVTALTGRRGTVRSRKRWVLVGLAMAAAGVGCAYLGAEHSRAFMLLAGVILFELGLVLCTPALVGLISRAGRFLPLSPRIALRDAGRNRSSAAPAISAVMAVVAFGIAASMFLVGDRERFSDANQSSVPVGSVVSEFWMPSPEAAETPGTVSDAELTVATDAVTDLMEKHYPIRQIRPVPSVECPMAEEEDWCEAVVVPPEDTACPFDVDTGLSEAEQAEATANPYCKQSNFVSGSSFSWGNFVVDGSTAATISGGDHDDEAEATATLQAGGIVVTDPDLLDDGMVTVERRDFGDGADFDVSQTITVPGYAIKVDNPSHELVFYSQEAADQLGMVDGGQLALLGLTDRPPSQAEQEAFTKALSKLGYDETVDHETGEPAIEVFSEVVEPPQPPAGETLAVNLLAIASGILALAATAVATALAAAESRKDLSTLAAIGASPVMRRKLSLFQAGIISMLGAVLGVLAGVGACFAAMGALNAQLSVQYPREGLYELFLPWQNIGIALLAVPVIAMLGAGLLTRSRLPSERRTV